MIFKYRFGMFGTVLERFEVISKKKIDFLFFAPIKNIKNPSPNASFLTSWVIQIWRFLRTFPWANRAHTLGFCSTHGYYKTPKYGSEWPTGRFSKIVKTIKFRPLNSAASLQNSAACLPFQRPTSDGINNDILCIFHSLKCQNWIGMMSTDVYCVRIRLKEEIWKPT